MAKQQWDGIFILRAALGLWLISAPWLLPGSPWPHRLSGALAGLVVLAVAFTAERLPPTRFVQAATGVWVMFSAAVFAPAPIMISAIVSGMVVLFSAAASHEMFT